MAIAFSQQSLKIIPNLLLWSDCNNISSITHASNNVSQWNDLINGVNWTQSGSNKPVLGFENTIHRWGMHFTSSQNLTNSLAFNFTSNDWTIFAVVRKSSSSSSFQGIFSNRTGAADWIEFGNTPTDSGTTLQIESRNSGVITDYGTTVNITDDTYKALIITKSSSGSFAYANGVQVGTKAGNIGGGNTGAAWLGRWLINSQCFNGYIYEFAIFSRALSVSEIAFVNGYAKQKWLTT